jgi:type IV secretory pathway VirB2 component (pilin)
MSGASNLHLSFTECEPGSSVIILSGYGLDDRAIEVPNHLTNLITYITSFFGHKLVVIIIIIRGATTLTNLGRLTG